MAKIKNESGRRERKISVTASQKVYEGARILAALSGKSLNDYIFGLIEGAVQKNLPAIEKMIEAQKLYTPPADATVYNKQGSLFSDKLSDNTVAGGEIPN